MNDSQFRALVEESWRRGLTEEEQSQLTAWFALHTEARAAWEEEAALNRSLQDLPDIPLSSNFTSLVLQAAQRETTPHTERMAAARPSLWRRFTWRAAWAALMVSSVWFGYRIYHLNQVKEHGDVAKGLSALANVTRLSELVVLEDFDTIDRLTRASSEDEDLYAVLNQ